LRHGVFDYLAKPVPNAELMDVVRRALEKSRSAFAGSTRAVARAENEGSRSRGYSGQSDDAGGLPGSAQGQPDNDQCAHRGRERDGQGTPGACDTREQPRRTAPFIPINCAGLSETLLESELFGHVKGAFTGAASDRKGLFEVADKGTLFLDEIGDMPLPMQAKLLRVLEDGVIVPVGSTVA